MIRDRVGEALHDPIDERVGEARQAVQEAVATGLHGAGRSAPAPPPRPSVSATLVGSRISSRERVGAAASPPPSRRPRREPATSRRPRHPGLPGGAPRRPGSRGPRASTDSSTPAVSSSSWSRTRRPSSPSSSRYRSISVGDPVHELAGQEDRNHVAGGYGVLHLERGQRRQGGVEAAAEPLERGERLPGPLEQRGARLDDVLAIVAVDGDRRHRLRDGDDGDVDRTGHPLGGAVTGAGLAGRDGRPGTRWTLARRCERRPRPG